MSLWNFEKICQANSLLQSPWLKPCRYGYNASFSYLPKKSVDVFGDDEQQISSPNIESHLPSKVNILSQDNHNECIHCYKDNHETLSTTGK